MLAELRETLSGKKTEQLASELGETKRLHEEHSKEIFSLRQEITTANTNIKALVEQQQQLIKTNTEALSTVQELKEQLNDSVNSIKIVSSTIQNNLVRKVTDDLNNLTQEVSLKLGGSEKLKKEIEETADKFKEELQQLNQEIKRLKTVTANIKAEDFELAKFANKLTAADSEKIRLTRQIDSLQRLVSALRRQH